MTTECCWPFCGAGPKECDCADNVKKEVMQIDSNRKADCESGTVAPPPVSEAGGDLHTNDEKTNMTEEACKENAEKLTVSLPEPGINTANHASIRVIGYTADQLRAYGDERERIAKRVWLTAQHQAISTREELTLARVAELEAKLKDSEDVQFAMLGLIADIRKAAGDPMGKLMQSELVELIARQREECDKAKEVEESDFESMEMYRRARDRADRITAAARAVVDRRETPLWKDAPATAGFIA